MNTLYYRLLVLLAGAAKEELASHIQFLKVENEMQCSKVTVHRSGSGSFFGENRLVLGWPVDAEKCA